MSRIILLHDDDHQAVYKLLPWYITGTLDAAERATVDAHLAGCLECRAELTREQALGAAVKSLPDADRGWDALRARLETPAPPAVRPRTGQSWSWRSMPRGAKVAAFAAAQAAVILLTVTATPRAAPVAEYRTLSNAPTAAPGNVLVMFRPVARERDMRHALDQAGARLVDGPTSSDGYVLQVAPGERASALAKLRADDTVLLAEPIDAAANR